MNTDLLLAAAAAIDLEPESFNLSRWGEPKPENLCGSSGCVAGQVAAIVNPQAWSKYIHETPWLYVSEPEHPAEIAREALGLSRPEAQTLFQSSEWWAAVIKKLGLTDQYAPDGDGRTPDAMSEEELMMADVLSYVSPKQASEVLRALARGELNLEVLPIENCTCSFCEGLRVARETREGL